VGESVAGVALTAAVTGIMNEIRAGTALHEKYRFRRIIGVLPLYYTVTLNEVKGLNSDYRFFAALRMTFRAKPAGTKKARQLSHCGSG
jgi:hypothetical protein